MCRGHTGLIAFASLLGVFQSVIWVAATAVLILIYYCVTPVPVYNDKSDFFTVTLIKLYFEGPKCIPDGSYLGKFNEDYRTSVTLLGRDILLFVLIAYVILSVIYLVLSILLYVERRRPGKSFFTIGWSVITLILCALDALVTYTFVIDSFTLMDYFLNTLDVHDVILGSIPYIPLLLAIVSSRFVVLWIWNFFIGIYILFVGCCGSRVRKPNVQEISLKAEDKTPAKTVRTVAEKVEEKPKVIQDEPQRPTEDGDSVISEHFRTGFASDMIKLYPEYNRYRRSMEAVTRFSDENRTPREHHPHNWCYEPSSEVPPCRKSHPQNIRLQEATNEGYIEDEEVNRISERSIDFQHNLKNFESGQKKIKMLRPHPGKPVGVPVPPPLPPIGSCNC